MTEHERAHLGHHHYYHEHYEGYAPHGEYHLYHQTQSLERKTASEIESELSNQYADSVKKHHAYKPDFEAVFKDLTDLRGKEDETHFRADLAKINSDLHKHGYLPHMNIVEDGSGLAVVADSPKINNPTHAAIVSRSESAPTESAEESSYYKQLSHHYNNYNAWNSSVSGGGGAYGGYDSYAPESHIPGRTEAAEGYAFGLPTGMRKDLIDEALKLAGLPITPQNEMYINCIIENESGWNPNAINLTDSNAAKGDPSQGLMQTIPSTFAEYALPGYNTNIDDPLSNLVAGIRYAVARYPSGDSNNALARVPGIVSLCSNGSYCGY